VSHRVHTNSVCMAGKDMMKRYPRLCSAGSRMSSGSWPVVCASESGAWFFRNVRSFCGDGSERIFSIWTADMSQARRGERRQTHKGSALRSESALMMARMCSAADAANCNRNCTLAPASSSEICQPDRKLIDD
jgi:hypothetical protein